VQVTAAEVSVVCTYSQGVSSCQDNMASVLVVRMRRGWNSVPFSPTVGVQYCSVFSMRPLWFTRMGRRLGVHFFEAVGWMESILDCAARFVGFVRVCNWLQQEAGMLLTCWRRGIDVVQKLYCAVAFVVVVSPFTCTCCWWRCWFWCWWTVRVWTRSMRVAAGVAHLSLPSVRHVVSMTVLLYGDCYSFYLVFAFIPSFFTFQNLL